MNRSNRPPLVPGLAIRGGTGIVAAHVRARQAAQDTRPMERRVNEHAARAEFIRTAKPVEVTPIQPQALAGTRPGLEAEMARLGKVEDGLVAEFDRLTSSASLKGLSRADKDYLIARRDEVEVEMTGIWALKEGCEIALAALADPSTRGG
ncbi:MAG: hypothetical protein EOO28_13190 [Comamonadaceae bacterium]|nr:MAG: hypothetical protein EOO28_13190 [Comamonadaceae bacterium]